MGVVVVTGASRGVGRAIANFLIRAPSQNTIVLTARTADALEELKKLAPDRVAIVTGDICDAKTAEKTVETAIKEYGEISGLVLNHGTLDPVRRISDLHIEEIQQAFLTNFSSGAYLAALAIPHLRKSKGRIVITSSGAASNAYVGWGIYGSTKASQNMLAATLAVEEPEITTVAIRPGMVDTDMQKAIREQHAEHMNPEDMKKFTGAYESGQLVKPEDCGHVIAKLAIYATNDLSGKFLAWNDPVLESYRLKKQS